MNQGIKSTNFGKNPILLDNQHADLRSLKANLEETLEELRRQFFGTKSEKTASQKKKDEQPQETKTETKTVTVREHTREWSPKTTREELYADLPVREIVCPVPEAERHCDWCNAEMVPISRKFVREEIRITPAMVERIHYMQEVLICPECRKDQDGTFKKGPVPEALLPHSPVSASAAAYVIFSKCFMGLPYYRMESAFDQLGARIPRETMANWCILCPSAFLR